MIMVTHMSLALHPLEKHSQTENETRQQLGYANTGCRCDISAAALDTGRGWTLRFPF